MRPESEDEQERRKTRHIDVPLGAEVKRARQAFPLSRESLAEFLSVSVSTIQRYENGQQRIPAAHLWQMCRRLNLDIGRLFADLPFHVVPGPGFTERKVVFDHSDVRARALDAMARATGELTTDRLEIAVDVVKALKAKHRKLP